MELDVRLATGSQSEARARDDLRSILTHYDVEPWTFTTDVVIRDDGTPRSHPVLTLSTVNAGTTQLASYLHEQMHWFCATREDPVERLCAGELPERYPDAPPNGATDAKSTYLRLIVCWLEFDALRRLLGRDDAEAVIRKVAGTGVYRWAYDTIVKDFDGLADLFRGSKVAIDPLRGEPAYSQRRTEEWEAAYHREIQPWDLSRPHGAITRLLAEGALTGNVLDAGCGTAEDAMAIASHGMEVCGIDVAPTAIERAEAKASEREISIRLVAGDVLNFDDAGTTFTSVVDCGMFHILDDERQRGYVEALASLTRPGGVLFLLCFSEFVPGAGGPRRVSKADIRAAFSTGWRVVQIAPERYETRFENVGVPAWLARIVRLPSEGSGT